MSIWPEREREKSKFSLHVIQLKDKPTQSWSFLRDCFLRGHTSHQRLDRHRQSHAIGLESTCAWWCMYVSTLTYQINVLVRLPYFKKKPWSMFNDYFWAVNIISIDCLNSWGSVRSKSRNQVNQLKYFLLTKNNRQTLIKVFSQNHTGTFI